MMSISPKSFEAGQQGTTSQAPASQAAPPFGQGFTSAGFGQIGFGNPAGFGTAGTAAEATTDGMSQPATTPVFGTSMTGFGSTGASSQSFPAANFGNPTGLGQRTEAGSAGFGQLQASSAGFGQPQASSAGFGQQSQPNFAGFSQQPQASLSGFGAQAQQQAAPSTAFAFGQPATAGASQPTGPEWFQASHGGADAGQQPPSSFSQHNPASVFGIGGSAGQPSGKFPEPSCSLLCTVSGVMLYLVIVVRHLHFVTLSAHQLSNQINVWAARNHIAFAIECPFGIAGNMFITSDRTCHVQQDFYCGKPSVVQQNVHCN
jgi:hypothetical protein